LVDSVPPFSRSLDPIAQASLLRRKLASLGSGNESSWMQSSQPSGQGLADCDCHWWAIQGARLEMLQHLGGSTRSALILALLCSGRARNRWAVDSLVRLGYFEESSRLLTRVPNLVIVSVEPDNRMATAFARWRLGFPTRHRRPRRKASRSWRSALVWLLSRLARSDVAAYQALRQIAYTEVDGDVQRHALLMLGATLEATRPQDFFSLRRYIRSDPNGRRLAIGALAVALINDRDGAVDLLLALLREAETDTLRDLSFAAMAGASSSDKALEKILVAADEISELSGRLVAMLATGTQGQLGDPFLEQVGQQDLFDKLLSVARIAAHSSSTVAARVLGLAAENNEAVLTALVKAAHVEAADAEGAIRSLAFAARSAWVQEKLLALAANPDTSSARALCSALGRAAAADDQLLLWLAAIACDDRDARRGAALRTLTAAARHDDKARDRMLALGLDLLTNGVAILRPCQQLRRVHRRALRRSSR
jgi:hypothetical protein